MYASVRFQELAKASISFSNSLFSSSAALSNGYWSRLKSSASLSSSFNSCSISSVSIYLLRDYSFCTHDPAPAATAPTNRLYVIDVRARGERERYYRRGGVSTAC